MRQDTPFWRAVEGAEPIPPAAATLGWEFIDFDDKAGTIQAAFQAGRSFTTPMGDVLGGFQAAMLYDTVGPAVLATLGPDEFISTWDLSTHFLRTARPGRLIGRGHIQQRTGEIVVVAATLTDETGDSVATATATIQVIELDGSRQ